MSNHRQAIKTIRDYMSSGDLGISDEIRSAAALYTTLCQEANRRMADCEHLLRVNQRSEAIRQARLEPDLLELFADLQFPEMGRWEAFASHEQLPVPPRFDSQLAVRLNQAFADEQVVSELLTRLRSLTLARTPLPQRLDILRLLVLAEPTNLAWADDLASFEAVRFEQIRVEVTDAEKKNDMVAIKRIHHELSTGAASAPPLDVLAIVQEAYAKSLRKQGLQQLAAVVTGLTSAMAADDMNLVKSLEVRGREIIAEFGLPETDSGVALVIDAARWIDKEKKARKTRKHFDQAVAQLRAALEGNVDWYYIQEYHRVATSYPWALPRELSQAFVERSRARNQKQKMIIISITIALIAAAAVSIIFLVP